jgi:hypothetical protein
VAGVEGLQFGILLKNAFCISEVLFHQISAGSPVMKGMIGDSMERELRFPAYHVYFAPDDGLTEGNK